MASGVQDSTHRRRPSHDDGATRLHARSFFAGFLHGFWHETLRLFGLRRPPKNLDEVLELTNKQRSYCNYEPHDRILNLFHLSGTVVPAVALHPVFWASMAVYIVSAKTGWHSGISIAHLTVLGTLLTFALSLYTTSCTERYYSAYRRAVSLQSQIFRVTAFLQAIAPQSRDAYAARHVVRLLNAAHAAAYTGVNHVLTSTNFFDVYVKSHHLLTLSEHKALHELHVDRGGVACRQCIMWALSAVNHMRQAGITTDLQDNRLTQMVLDFSTELGHIFRDEFLSIPFGYFHFLNMISAVYLIALANAVTAIDGLEMEGELLLLITTNMGFLGLSELSVRLTYPIGLDVEDLPIMHFLQFAVTTSKFLLRSFPLLDAVAPDDADNDERQQNDVRAGDESKQGSEHLLPRRRASVMTHTVFAGGPRLSHELLERTSMDDLYRKSSRLLGRGGLKRRGHPPGEGLGIMTHEARGDDIATTLHRRPDNQEVSLGSDADLGMTASNMA